MKPRRTHESTGVYRLVGGTEDNDLWVTETFDSEQPNVPVVCSVWEPTDEERARIAAGENIELAVWGGQPPVALQLTDVEIGKARSEAGAQPTGDVYGTVRCVVRHDGEEMFDRTVANDEPLVAMLTQEFSIEGGIAEGIVEVVFHFDPPLAARRARAT